MEYINLNPTYRGRVRTGCLTCRSKRVKCTEEHPACKTCVRLRRDCVYEAPSPKARKVVPGVRHRSRIVQAARALPPLRPLCTDSYEGETRSDDLHDVAVYPQQSLSHQDSLMPAVPSLRSPVVFDSSASPEAISLLTSQDIHICTTIDWLSANDSFRALSFDYFLTDIDLPQITPVDPFEWRHVKEYICAKAKDHNELAAAITAVQLLWRAQMHALPISQAQTQRKTAEDMLESMLQNVRSDFEIAVLAMTVLSLFCVVAFDEKQSVFSKFNDLLLRRFDLYKSSSERSEKVTRVAAWLGIIQAAARRGGNKGIVSAELADAFANEVNYTSSLPAHHIDPVSPDSSLEAAVATVFQLYYHLQQISLEITNLSHYHRSRRTAADQDEVERVMENHKHKLHSLWQSRPTIIDADVVEINSRFEGATSQARETLDTTIAATISAYHAEVVEIGRTLSDPHFRTPESVEGLQLIRQVVDSVVTSPLSPAFLRPLFLYAIETLEIEDAAWAVRRMRDIRDPIARSDFFAAYAEGLAAEQFERGRRVTTRWFCYQHFGIQPPFL